ncbi:unnamed protein product [Timema podura]|uniref:Uncharacterized protein n=1 Tax=Timema podura TaxID=61482 RepID=A0ABN7NHV4_TIMPD|nr:unnamed protein product [Timema podura]
MLKPTVNTKPSVASGKGWGEWNICTECAITLGSNTSHPPLHQMDMALAQLRLTTTSSQEPLRGFVLDGKKRVRARIGGRGAGGVGEREERSEFPEIKKTLSCISSCSSHDSITFRLTGTRVISKFYWLQHHMVEWAFTKGLSLVWCGLPVRGEYLGSSAHINGTSPNIHLSEGGGVEPPPGIVTSPSSDVGAASNAALPSDVDEYYSAYEYPDILPHNNTVNKSGQAGVYPTSHSLLLKLPFESVSSPKILLKHDTWTQESNPGSSDLARQCSTTEISRIRPVLRIILHSQFKVFRRVFSRPVSSLSVEDLLHTSSQIAKLRLLGKLRSARPIKNSRNTHVPATIKSA